MRKADLIRKVANELRSMLTSKFGEKVACIILYGSYARGDYDDESDMDIMVLFDCLENDVRTFRKDISLIASEIGLENDILVSIVVRDTKSFSENQNKLPFYQNVIKEGRMLYGAI